MLVATRNPSSTLAGIGAITQTTWKLLSPTSAVVIEEEPAAAWRSAISTSATLGSMRRKYQQTAPRRSRASTSTQIRVSEKSTSWRSAGYNLTVISHRALLE